jgi:PAS domain S-box-containing protein
MLQSAHEPHTWIRPTEPPPASALALAARMLALGAVYALAGALGIALAGAGPQFALLWLPTGIAVVGMLRWGPVMAWPVALIALAFGLSRGFPATSAIAAAVGGVTGPIVIAWGLQRFGLDPAFRRNRDFSVLAAVAAVGVLIPATTTVSVLFLNGMVPAGGVRYVWVGWYGSVFVGVLLMVPLLLGLSARAPRDWVAGWRAGLHRVLVVAAMLAGGAALGAGSEAGDPSALTAVLLLALATVLAALRFGVVGTWLALVCTCAIVAAMTVLGHGPFVRSNPYEGAFLAWQFELLITGVSMLMMGHHQQRSSMQDTIARRESQMRAMFEQSNAGMNVTQSGRFVMVNDAFCAMLGYRREELIGKNFLEVTHPDDHRATVAASIEALRRAPDSAVSGPRFEKRYLHRDGSIVWGRLAVSGLAAEPGAVPRALAVVMDVTEHKRAEAAMHRQREQLTLVFGATGSGIWDHDLVRGLYFYSDAYLRILGHAPGTRLERLSNDPDRLHPADRMRMLAIERALIESHVPFDAEYRLKRADGEYLWVHGVADAAWDGTTGRATRFYGAITDISARKAAEAALVDSRARLSAVISSAIDAIVAVDDESRIVLFNPAAEALFGWRASDVVGRSMHRLTPARLRLEPLQQIIRMSLEPGPDGGPSGRGTLAALHADGTELRVDASIAMVTVGTGFLVTLVMRDARERDRVAIAERARAEAEAASRAKSAFLSRMSHELRTPLHAVLGFAQLLDIDDTAPLTEAQRERVRAIREAGSHLGALIDELLDLTRIEGDRMRLEQVDLDLADMVRQSMRLASPAAAAASVRIMPPAESPVPLRVLADPTRLRQVLLNLLGNAVKYNRAGGGVRVRTGSDGREAAWVEIEDDGPGISAADQQRLFEPFERLGRERGAIEGSGIGLALSRRLVTLMGGRIEVDSEPGRGSVFRVRLPLTSARSPAAIGYEVSDRPA